ncbi:MAG: hypothetical protein PVG03_07735 [Desulfarculaceae bacterium]|jgi:hypothetical protein
MRVTRIFLALAVALAGLLLTSCQTATDLVDEFDPRERPAQKAYLKAVAPFISKGSIYEGPATALQAKAMWLGQEVRQAMARRRAAAFGLREDEFNKLIAEQNQEAARHYEVALSLFVPNKKWNNLTSAQPAWKVYLQNQAGARLEPKDRRLIKKRTAISEALYPFWGPWDRLYRLRFPRNLPSGEPFAASAGERVTLVIAGVPGSIRLILTPEKASNPPASTK